MHQEEAEGIELGSVIRAVPWGGPCRRAARCRSPLRLRHAPTLFGPSTTLLLHVSAGRLDVFRRRELEVAALAWASARRARLQPPRARSSRLRRCRLSPQADERPGAVRCPAAAPAFSPSASPPAPRPLAEEHAAFLAGTSRSPSTRRSARGDSSPQLAGARRERRRGRASAVALALRLARRCARWAASQPPFKRGSRLRWRHRRGADGQRDRWPVTSARGRATPRSRSNERVVIFDGATGTNIQLRELSARRLRGRGPRGLQRVPRALPARRHHRDPPLLLERRRRRREDELLRGVSRRPRRVRPPQTRRTRSWRAAQRISARGRR